MARRGRLGESAARPDGIPKVRGQFAFSSDLFAEGMLWGHILRSPHPAATIRSVDVSLAMRIPGVRAVLVADDVPGRKTYEIITPTSRSSPRMWSGTSEPLSPQITTTTLNHASHGHGDHRRLRTHQPLTDPVAAIDAEPIHPLGNVLYRR